MLLSLLAAALAAPHPAEPRFEAVPCADPRLVKVARCGIVRVPEHRGRPEGGRTIALNVVVLPAATPGSDLPPLYDMDGGPGLPATKNVVFYAGPGAAYRQRRDIVLVDQRGTGASNGLHCPELSDAASAFAEMLPPAAVDSCREALATRADLTRYGTAEAVADLDAVRTALGHDRLDIFALSYGTTVAWRYMAAYPGRVRAAVLMGFAPPDAMPPRHHAGAGERALGLLFEDCAADPACRTAFPDPAADLGRLAARLDAGKGPMPRELFMEKLRTLMYQPAGARRVPWIVHEAAGGNFEPFHSNTRPQGPPLLADGMFLSVTCAESFGAMDYEAAAAQARATPFGDYRLRRQRAACARWPSKTASAAGAATSPRPGPALLFVSGRLDPVTPPEWAEAAARAMPGSRHLVLRDGGHLLDGLAGADSCFDPLVVRFYETADPLALDASCIGEMKAGAFATGAEAAQTPAR